MEALSSLIKVSLANYIQNLPIPDSFFGILSLSIKDWLYMTPFIGGIGYVGFLTYRLLRPSQICNPSVNKASKKVVDIIDIEDMTSDKVSYCRCWRSKKFPLCDGSHNKHNEDTGDNAGPLVIKKNS
ncbi:hypothetical protein EB796_022893 [Bugula neritina]|uniref:Iron-binding zinc finger CDGSH type domain-containing protein n=1 Tax=Bugula neritina TaxID=10212 RepID=A0A7J7IY48_BUGNE|nr:hypothetical protein EB796_022893 [Bugula neritina]